MKSPLFLVPVVVGLVFIIAGWILLKFPPKKINLLYGYRTRNSMKNQQSWNFAQLYSAKEMIKGGLLLSLTSIPGLFYHPNETVSAVIVLGIMLIVILIIFIRVEKAIVRNLKAIVILAQDIQERVEQDFKENATTAFKVLEEAILKYDYLNDSRILRCILFLSDKNIEKLKSSIEAAAGDPRDVMLWAEYENKGQGDNFKRLRDFNKPFEQADL